MPSNSQPTKEKILLAATETFAAENYDSVTMRKIAARAQTPLALLHYHFGTKAQLYRAIWLANYEAPTHARHVRLNAVDFDRPVEVVVRELADIFARPPLLAMQGSKTRAFAMVMVREASDSKEDERGVIQDFLDPSGRRFLRAFARALPELSATEVAWGYHFMAGAVLFTLFDTSRLARLSRNAASRSKIELALPLLLDYLVGGWMLLRGRARRDSSPRSPPMHVAAKSRIPGARSTPRSR